MIAHTTFAKLSVALFCMVTMRCAARAPSCSPPSTCVARSDCEAPGCVPDQPRTTTDRVAESRLDRWVGETIEAVQLTPIGSIDPSIAPNIRLGSSLGPSLVLLKFAPIWQRTGEIDGAFLLLEPASNGSQLAGDLPIEVWRITEDWVSDEVSWLKRPTLSYPFSRAVGRSGRSPVRVDVTEHIRSFAEHPRAAFGLAIRCEAKSGGGISYSTGFGGGAPPRLEVYSRGSRPATAR